MATGSNIGELKITISVMDKNSSKVLAEVERADKRLRQSVKKTETAMKKSATTIAKEELEKKKLKIANDRLALSAKDLIQKQQKQDLVTKKLAGSEQDLIHKQQKRDITTRKLAITTAKVTNAEQKLLMATNNTQSQWLLGNPLIDKMNKKLNQLRWSMVNVAFAGAAVGLLVGPFAKFGAEIDTISRRLKSLSGGSQSIAGISDSIANLRMDTPFSFKEMGEGMTEFVKAGFSVEETFEVMPKIADLASAGFATLGESVTVVAQLMHQFSIPAKDAGKMIDFLAKAANESATDVITFGNAMAYVGPVAEQAGWSFEETAASMMLLANAGLRGTKSGTALRQALSQLVNPTNDAQEAMTMYGQSFADADGNIKGASDTIRELSVIVKTFSPAEAQKALAKIFPNIRGRVAIQALINDYINTGEAIDDVVDKTKELNYAQKIAAEQYESAVNRMKTSWGNFKTAFMDASTIIITRLADIVELMEKAFGGKYAGVKIGGAAAAVGIGGAVGLKSLSKFLAKGSITNPMYVVDVGKAGVVGAIAGKSSIGVNTIASGGRNPYTGAMQKSITKTITDAMKVGGSNVAKAVSGAGSALGTLFAFIVGPKLATSFGSFFKNLAKPGAFTAVVNALIKAGPLIGVAIAGAIAAYLDYKIFRDVMNDEGGEYAQKLRGGIETGGIGKSASAVRNLKAEEERLRNAGLDTGMLKPFSDITNALIDNTKALLGWRDERRVEELGPRKTLPKKFMTEEEFNFDKKYGSLGGGLSKGGGVAEQFKSYADYVKQIDQMLYRKDADPSIAQKELDIEKRRQEILNRNYSTYVDMKKVKEEELDSVRALNAYLSKAGYDTVDTAQFDLETNNLLFDIKEYTTLLNAAKKEQDRLRASVSILNDKLADERKILSNLNNQLQETEAIISNLAGMRFTGETEFMKIISGESQKNALEELSKWGITDVKGFVDNILAGSVDAWKDVRFEIEKTEDVLKNSKNTYEAWQTTLDETIRDLIKNSQDLSTDVSNVVQDAQTQLLSTSKFGEDKTSSEEKTKLDLLQMAYDAYYGNMHNNVNQFIQEDEDRINKVADSSDIVISKLKGEFNVRDGLTSKIADQNIAVDAAIVLLEAEQILLKNITTDIQTYTTGIETATDSIWNQITALQELNKNQRLSSDGGTRTFKGTTDDFEKLYPTTTKAGLEKIDNFGKTPIVSQNTSSSDKSVTIKQINISGAGDMNPVSARAWANLIGKNISQAQASR